MEAAFTILLLGLALIMAVVFVGTSQQYEARLLFNISAVLTNTSYVYYYDVKEISARVPETIELVNVTYEGQGMSNVWVYIEDQWGQYVAVMHVVVNGRPTTEAYEATLQPGNYYVSVLIQPDAPVHYGEKAVVTLYSIVQPNNA